MKIKIEKMIKIMNEIYENEEFSLRNQLTIIGAVQEISKLFSISSEMADTFTDEVEDILEKWNKKASELEEIHDKLLN